MSAIENPALRCSVGGSSKTCSVAATDLTKSGFSCGRPGKRLPTRGFAATMLLTVSTAFGGDVGTVIEGGAAVVHDDDASAKDAPQDVAHFAGSLSGQQRQRHTTDDRSVVIGDMCDNGVGAIVVDRSFTSDVASAGTNDVAEYVSVSTYSVDPNEKTKSVTDVVGSSALEALVSSKP